MADTFALFRQAIADKDGYSLAKVFIPTGDNKTIARLQTFFATSDSAKIETDVRYGIIYHSEISLSRAEGTAWLDIFTSFWKAIGELLTAQDAAARGRDSNAYWARAYESWREVVNMLIRAYQQNNGAFEAWTIPCLYMAGKYLRLFAIQADDQVGRQKPKMALNAGFQDDIVESFNEHEKLEDAARQINRIFSLCISDRSPLAESRKWGLYYTANLLFKTYFKLGSISLCKNIIKSLQAVVSDLPPLEAFPKSHQVTFLYYSGVIHFLEEDYAKAEECLTSAYRLCHKAASRNRELILTYLIPCHLLTTHTLPTQSLLAPYPRLVVLFEPIAVAIKHGNLAGFDAALAAGEKEFVKRRIYLTLERGRDVALRNLFRRVFLAGGFDPMQAGQNDADRIRRTRIPVDEFTAAVRLSLRQKDDATGNTTNGSADVDMMDRDEVECLLANMIYKNLMKGYISRERSMVVLSKGGAFPGTGV